MLSAELQELRDGLRAIKAGIRQVERDIAWNRVIDSAIRMCRVLCKAELAEIDAQYNAKYRADQPRVPAGNPDGGQWTYDGGGGGSSDVRASDEGRVISDANPDNYWKPGAQLAQANLPVPGGGDGPPTLPPNRPSKAVGYAIGRLAARWIVEHTEDLVLLKERFEQVTWAYVELWPSVKSYIDPPQSLQSLQRSHLGSEAGYEEHHNVEKAAAARAGFPSSMIESRANVLRIPKFKHWEVTGAFMIVRKELGNKSYRQYLEGKSWQERERIGHEILREKGILK